MHVREAQDPRYPANSAYQQFYNDTFMNGTFCSNSASTLYYLFRQQPYTSALIDLQSNHFDAPDRMFHSYDCLYKIIFETSYKEHIPQLLSSLKFELNTFNFDIGKRQNGRVVGDLDFDANALIYGSGPSNSSTTQEPENMYDQESTPKVDLHLSITAEQLVESKENIVEEQNDDEEELVDQDIIKTTQQSGKLP